MSQPTDNFWHQRFNQDTYFYGTEPNDFLRENITVLPSQGRILSIGEGEGRNAVFLAQHGFEVTAIDGAASGLEKAKKLAEKRGVSINTQCLDLKDYVFEEEKWDGIIAIFCHLPPLLRQQVHKQIIKALKPNGIFLLEAYHPQQLSLKTGGPGNVELLYEVSTLQQDFEGLKFLYAEEKQRPINEGEGHNGISAVVQLIAKK